MLCSFWGFELYTFCRERERMRWTLRRQTMAYIEKDLLNSTQNMKLTYILDILMAFFSLCISIGLCSCCSVCVCVCVFFLFIPIHAVTSRSPDSLSWDSSFAKCTSNISYYWTGLVTVVENCFQMNQTSLFSLIDTNNMEKRTDTRSINEIFNVQPGRQFWIYIEIKFSSKCVQSSWHKCCSQLVRQRSSIQTNNKNINKTADPEEKKDVAKDEEEKKSFPPKLTKDKLIENRKKG